MSTVWHLRELPVNLVGGNDRHFHVTPRFRATLFHVLFLQAPRDVWLTAGRIFVGPAYGMRVESPVRHAHPPGHEHPPWVAVRAVCAFVRGHREGHFENVVHRQSNGEQQLAAVRQPGAVGKRLPDRRDVAALLWTPHTKVLSAPTVQRLNPSSAPTSIRVKWASVGKIDAGSFLGNRNAGFSPVQRGGRRQRDDSLVGHGFGRPK